MLSFLRTSGKISKIASALLAGALVISGCGGGGGNSSGGTGSSASQSGTAILEWNSSSDPNLAGYRVYFGSSAGAYNQGPGLGLYAANTTTYTVTGLTSGTRYYFAVTAYDTRTIESGYSNEVFKDIP